MLHAEYDLYCACYKDQVGHQDIIYVLYVSRRSQVEPERFGAQV